MIGQLRMGRVTDMDAPDLSRRRTQSMSASSVAARVRAIEHQRLGSSQNQLSVTRESGVRSCDQQLLLLTGAAGVEGRPGDWRLGSRH